MQLNNQLLVFPTSRAIREYIVAQQNTNTLLPKLITIDELFKNSIFLGDKKYIDENLRVIYLKEAISQQQFDTLGLSNNLSDFFRQSDFIFRFLGELSHENLDIDTLAQYDTYAHYSDHLDILKNIQKNYLQTLDKHNLIDKINLPQNYQFNDEYVKNFDQITIYLEGYLSSFESSIIKQVATFTDTIIDFEYNSFNQKSIEQFDINSLELKLEKHYKVNLSENKILEQNDSIKEICNPNIAAFSSKIDQIGYIKYAIYDMVENHNIVPEDIVLVTPDESFGKTLKLFDKEHYFNFAFGFDITTSKTYEIITSCERELNEREQQTKEKLQFLEIDNDIFNNLQNVWNKQFTIEEFENFNTYIYEQEENNDIKQEYEKIIYSIVHLFKTNSLEITFKELFKILIQKLSKITLDDTQGGKITVMGILETRAIDFQGVIVCDFNDNVVPRKSTKDKFLSTHIKKLANLPTSQDRQNLQIYYYNKLFKNTKHLYISYVENDENTISRFSSILFPNTKLEDIQDKNYKHILFENIEKQATEDQVLLDIDLSTKSWSASSLKRYLECKRKYYLHDIIKIKEHHFSFRPQNFEIGTLLHDILERIYLKNNSFLEINHLYSELLKELSNEKKSNPYLVFEIELWKRKIKKFIENDINRFNQGITVQSCEKPFRTIYNGININGKIDRVDLNKDGTVDILDYKTSKALTVSSEKNYEKSVDFQLEFYYLALEQEYKINQVAYYDLNTGKIKPEIMLDKKLLRLEEVFEALKTTQVDFEKCDNKQICSICTYNTICQKD